MKLNLRKAIWVFALTVTLNVFSMSRLASAYQSEEGKEHGHGHDKDKEHGHGHDKDNDNANNSNYQRGFSHGQDDGANHRNHQYRLRLDNDADRHAYEAGYDQGYQDSNRRGQYDHDRDVNGANNGHYGQYGHNGSNHNPGAQTGFQDGLRDGQQDRQTGHSNRPTKGDNYKNATRGYNSNLGGETQYKVSYRQAYVQGYQQGYERNGQLGEYDQYGRNGSQAAQIGSQDGLNDGRQDRQSGHSNRPTKGDNYKNATRGYNSSLGGQTQYKAEYRQAYLPAYQEGYNDQGYVRR